MADYSGYWSCSECGASGNNYSHAPHGPTCSVPGKIADMAREREAKKEREAVQREARLESWRALDDETLLAELKLSKDLADAKRREWDMLNGRVVLGLEVVKERNLLRRWLRI